MIRKIKPLKLAGHRTEVRVQRENNVGGHKDVRRIHYLSLLDFFGLADVVQRIAGREFTRRK